MRNEWLSVAASAAFQVMFAAVSFSQVPQANMRYAEDEAAPPVFCIQASTASTDPSAGFMAKCLAHGFDGRVAGTERLCASNVITAVDCARAKTWRARAWRNERAHAQLALWTGKPVPQVWCRHGDLKSAAGDLIPASALTTRFEKFVMTSDNTMVADVLDTTEEIAMPANSFRPVWLTVKVPAVAKPGVYQGTVKVFGVGARMLTFSVELEVIDRTLPAPQDWKFFLDIWQNPYAVARFHSVVPFSPEHYALMEPLYRELAAAGQKALTVTITEKPWDNQCFDKYLSMVKRVLKNDQTWNFDFTVFDRYVEFGRACGIGPQIHCYSLVPWKNYTAYYLESGERVERAYAPGTPEYNEYWAPFLTAFARHVVAKGWAGDTVVSLDERKPEELAAVVRLVKKCAPALKISMAGNVAPDFLKDAEVNVFSQALFENLAKEINQMLDRGVPAKRRAAGDVTTFYVISSVPKRPNINCWRPTAECVWMGHYAAAAGLDGFLFWGANQWNRNPFIEFAFREWKKSNIWMLYPNGRCSIRWEMLREGIEDFEKIRCLRESGVDMAAIDTQLKKYRFPDNASLSEADFEKMINGTCELLNR